MSLCDACYRRWDAWNSYPFDPGPITLMQIGGTRVQDIRMRRRVRYESWRDTILRQQKLIAEMCRSRHGGERD